MRQLLGEIKTKDVGGFEAAGRYVKEILGGVPIRPVDVGRQVFFNRETFNLTVESELDFEKRREKSGFTNVGEIKEIWKIAGYEFRVMKLYRGPYEIEVIPMNLENEKFILPNRPKALQSARHNILFWLSREIK